MTNELKIKYFIEMVIKSIIFPFQFVIIIPSMAIFFNTTTSYVFALLDSFVGVLMFLYIMCGFIVAQCLLSLPMIYISFVTPHKIWQKLCVDDCKTIKNKKLFWKIPALIAIISIQFCAEFYLPAYSRLYNTGLLLNGAILVGEILILRIITYSVMLLIWQPNCLLNLFTQSDTTKVPQKRKTSYVVADIVLNCCYIAISYGACLYISLLTLMID